MIEFIMHYWLEVLFGAALSFLGLAYKKLERRIKEQDAIKLGIQALLHDRIISQYNYYKDLGYCPIYAMENINAMYLQYHALGGNGIVTELVERLKDMPDNEKATEVKEL
ncbi:hypothetical protein [Hydrogenoanaerobacterium sp.]|uniref:hypothetical protein n=1 Tax=Hydrogenoanaerobacterium sp. TaxID=2953763 RepID=UPI00289A5AFD|nr:hypothetical protein [Hydrogenoanaerobacterium sp.]